ncbi:MAG: cell division protein FtsQ/DivIB [Alphaproteobacteria bacterium]|nr:cell division protein FtsQ/DivIB [Alphaproteobacteria bacterium]
MRKKKTQSLRGSVTQNGISVRMRARDEDWRGFIARLGILAGGFALLVGIALWLWRVGWLQEQGQRISAWTIAMTQKAHFAISDVAVEGRQRTGIAALDDAVGAKRGAPILAFDPEAAAARIQKLPWVSSAIVERRLPGTIDVVLTEHQPAARWQRDERFYVIDSGGELLPQAKAADFPSLPLVVGTGANSAAHDLLISLGSYPAIETMVHSAVRVGERRWDLHMANKIVVRLPEGDVGDALRRLSILANQYDILNRNVDVIDLRVPGRLIVEPATADPTTGVNKK